LAAPRRRHAAPQPGKRQPPCARACTVTPGPGALACSLAHALSTTHGEGRLERLLCAVSAALHRMAALAPAPQWPHGAMSCKRVPGSRLAHVVGAAAAHSADGAQGGAGARRRGARKAAQGHLALAAGNSLRGAPPAPPGRSMSHASHRQRPAVRCWRRRAASSRALLQALVRWYLGCFTTARGVVYNSDRVGGVTIVKAL